jgi:multidrug resistance protein
LPKGFGVLWSTVAIDLIGFGIAIPVLALYAEQEFGASATQAGLLFASFSLAQFVMAPIMGRLSDRIGRKPVILLSLFGTAVGSFLTGAAPALWMLFLGRVVDGASGASVSVAQAAATDLADPKDRPRVLGLLGAAFGIGFTVGPAIGGLAAWLGGRRAPFYVAAVLALVNGLVAIRRLPETRGRRAPQSASPGRLALSSALKRLVVVTFLVTMAFSAFEATFSLFGERRFDLTESSVAWVFVLVGLSQSVVQGRAIAPITERWGSRSVLLGALTVNAAGLAVLAVSKVWVVLLLALLLLVVGQGLASPSASTLVANAAGSEERGRVLGVQQSAGSLARVIGPAAGGLLFQHAGVPVPYLVGAGVMALAAAALLSG